MELVQSVLAIVAFVKAGLKAATREEAIRLYAQAAVVAGRLVSDLLEKWLDGNVFLAAAATGPEKTCEQLCDDLEAACAPKATGGEDFAALPPLVLPILLLLLKKLLEQLAK